MSLRTCIRNRQSFAAACHQGRFAFIKRYGQAADWTISPYACSVRNSAAPFFCNHACSVFCAPSLTLNKRHKYFTKFASRAILQFDFISSCDAIGDAQRNNIVLCVLSSAIAVKVSQAYRRKQQLSVSRYYRQLSITSTRERCVPNSSANQSLQCI